MSLVTERADIRDRLAAALEIPVFDHLEEAATPTCAFVGPGQPYIQFPAGADTDVFFGEVIVRHRIVLVVEAGDNDYEADQLDQLIARTLPVDFGAHLVTTIDEPGPAPVNGQTFLGVAINLVSALPVDEL